MFILLFVQVTNIQFESHASYTTRLLLPWTVSFIASLTLLSEVSILPLPFPAELPFFGICLSMVDRFVLSSGIVTIYAFVIVSSLVTLSTRAPS